MQPGEVLITQVAFDNFMWWGPFQLAKSGWPNSPEYVSGQSFQNMFPDNFPKYSPAKCSKIFFPAKSSNIFRSTFSGQLVSYMTKQQSLRKKKAVKNYGCQVILYWPEPKQNQDPAMAIFGIL